MDSKQHNLIEKALLGLIILKPSLVSKITGVLSIDNFVLKENKLIFNIIEELSKEKEDFDQIILIDRITLKSSKNSEFWINYLSELTIESGYESNIDKYIEILTDKKHSKDLEETLNISLSEVKKKDLNVKELIEKIETDIFNVTRNRELKKFENVSKITKDFLKKLELIKENGYTEGENTQLKRLDSILGGFKKGELIIIAARPSMGKTAFALQIISNISKQKSVGLFSLEMPSQAIIQRLVSMESGVSQDTFREYDKIPENRIEIIKKTISRIGERHIWIDDTPGLRIGELSWKIRKLNTMVKLDMVVIDYLQLIEGDKNSTESRQQIISDISRTLKSLARELSIPIIALSQLSRKVESREDKKPMMSDLRESGAIEQDADVILLLYRPEYYKKGEKFGIMEELEIIISKNRNGKTGSVKLDMNMELGRITSKNLGGF